MLQRSLSPTENLMRVDSAMSDVSRYQAQHRGLGAAIAVATGSASTVDPESLKARQQQELKNTHARNLQNVGLALVEGEQGSFAVLIKDSVKFGQFIDQLKANQGTAPSLDQNKIRRLIPCLTLTVSVLEAGQMLNQETAQPYMPIIRTFESLGFADDVRSIKRLVIAALNGFLTEYLMAREAQLIPEATRVGPDRWHLDATPATLKQKWGKALDTLEELLNRNNPEARRLVAQAKQYLTTSMDKLQAWVTDPEDQPVFKYHPRQLFQDVIKPASARLNYILSDPELTT